jgi:division protein CdvB (Snf7/Vps24/ESCRT-III family)
MAKRYKLLIHHNHVFDDGSSIYFTRDNEDQLSMLSDSEKADKIAKGLVEEYEVTPAMLDTPEFRTEAVSPKEQRKIDAEAAVGSGRRPSAKGVGKGGTK